VTKLGVTLIPKKTARKFVDGVEKRLARSNFKHKTRLPVELMEAYGAKRSREGFTDVVFGHFHNKLVMPTAGATITVLPAWYESGEAMRIDPSTGAADFVVI
jgi:UDP-2,3-diacylglucosamine pyrophosphatase LpxH